MLCVDDEWSFVVYKSFMNALLMVSVVQLCSTEDEQKVICVLLVKMHTRISTHLACHRTLMQLIHYISLES